MKDQTSPIKDVVVHGEPVIHEDNIVIPGKQDRASGNESDEDSGFLNASNASLDTCIFSNAGADGKAADEAIDVCIEDEDEDRSESPAWKLNLPPKPRQMSEEELRKIVTEINQSYEGEDEQERRKRAMDKAKELLGEVLPISLLEIIVAHSVDGDTGISFDTRPEWLDLEKFYRGQKFTMDNIFGINYANVLSLFTIFTFEEGLKPIIASGESSTPYTSFKRYLSTASRFINWYSKDPWTPGTPAYTDMKAVRRIHALVRRRTEAMSDEEYKLRTTIQNPWCPTLPTAIRDFQSTCPAPKPGQCPYTVLGNFPEFRGKQLSQAEMISTQFAFVSLVVLYPKFFGIHEATDEDLDAYCHLWRGLGYLLGIDDEFNFCRGSLEDVKKRSSDFLEYWVKPNFRVVKPEWEHMTRCIIEGLQYYFPGTTFETALLDVTQMLNLHMPRLYSSLSYSTWIKHNTVRFFFDYGAKFSAVRSFLNRMVLQAMERAKKFDEDKHKELQERSAKTLDDYLSTVQKKQSTVEPCTE